MGSRLLSVHTLTKLCNASSRRPAHLGRRTLASMAGLSPAGSAGSCPGRNDENVRSNSHGDYCGFGQALDFSQQESSLGKSATIVDISLGLVLDEDDDGG
jgi:hypothetical protein